MPHNDGRKTGKNGKGLGVGRRKGDKSIHNPGNMTSERAKEIRAKDDPEKKRLGGIKQSATKNAKATLQRITTETQDFLRQELLTPDEFGHIYVHDFISSFLTEAKENPNSRAASFLAQSMFTPDLLVKLDADVNRQMAKDADFLIYRIRNTLYDKQKEVFDDLTSRTIECICTRRAGKTELVARILVREAAKPPYITPVGKPLERSAIYLNRSFDNAVSQMGKPVTNLLDSLDIKYEGSPGSGKITLSNGGTITFGGYNNKGDIDRFRGEHYSLVAIDEISHLRNPKVLMQETLEPALADYGPDGHIIMTGTPPRTKKSYAYEQWHNPNIKHYHWSFMDNPYIPNKEEIIEKVCKEHNVTIEAPFVQREYYGNMEAFDVDAMVFRGYKTMKPISQGIYDRAYVGVDFGFEDEAAVVSFVAKNKRLMPVDEWHASKQSISSICNEIKRQYDNLKKLGLAYEPDIICDNNEKGAVYELSETYGLPNVYCAYKYNRDVAIEQLAEWLRTDIIFVKENGYLAEECESTLWKRDDETDEIMHEIDDDVYHPNGLMALLYLSRHFAYEELGYVDGQGTDIKESVE